MRCSGSPRCRPRLRASIASIASLGALVLVFGAPSRALRYEAIYPVERIVVEYALDHPRHIPEREVLDLEIGLRAGEEAYVAPRPVDRTVRMRLSALPRNASFSASALLHINQHIVATFNRRGYNGVIVTVPDVEEGSGRDLRAPGDRTLRLRIWTGRITRVTSVADGERFGGLAVDERSNHAAHEWIRARSPVRPGGERGLLSVVALEDYAARASRHPGRRVDVEIEPGPTTGTSDVNFRVAENKPWYVYAQYTNTGTSSTTRNRERFGFTHNQLLGRDDILQIDYTTGDFDRVHAVVASYEAPLFEPHSDWRFALSGWYSEFDVEEAGFVGARVRVQGDEASAGAEISKQILQRGALFLDAALGARWQHLGIENEQLAPLVLESDVNYALPHVDLRLVRDTATSSTRARIGLVGGWSDTRDSELEDGAVALDLFGTPLADDDFVLAGLDASASFFLEPWIDRRAWEDPSTPQSSTLAHELAFVVRGQWALTHRLLPQFRQVAGGFTTVRGYRQSQVVGDDLVLGSAEYRFHLPRSLRPDPRPPELPGVGLFRARPPQVWGAPDWDLIFRVFTDAAHLRASDALASEPDETLWSVGGGIELQLLRNLTLRGDVGYALLDLERDRDTKGRTRGHVAATLLY